MSKQTEMPEVSAVLGSVVKVIVDRPLGSYHPKHKDIFYGYVLPMGSYEMEYTLSD